MRRDKQLRLALCLCGVIPVVWLALLAAPGLGGGLAGLLQGGVDLSRPFHIVLCEDSGKTVLVFLLLYGLGIGIWLSTERNYRRREEHGSARWGVPSALDRKYASRRRTENKILTQHVALGLDGRRHRRNLNILVVGGSGAGKTRFFAKPNIMNANTSLIVLDCKSEILRSTGGLLRAEGYDIKVLDLINMEKSHCYNPFVYPTVCRTGAHPPFGLCGGAQPKYRQELSEELCSGLSGGRGHRACLHHLFGVCREPADGGPGRGGGYHGVELCGGAHFQHAHPGGLRKDGGPHRAGDAGAVSQRQLDLMPI